MVKPLRIAILAPLKRAITPDVTASRPRVIVDLVSELVARGHKVTIFGTGDSTLPGVEIVPIVPKALNTLPASENPFYQHTAFLVMQIKILVDRQADFDIVHNHMYPEFLALLSGASLQTPLVTTVHAQMTAEMAAVLRQFSSSTLIAISESAAKLSGLPLSVIHNGIDTELFTVNPEVSREYLLFVGRMSKAKDAAGKFLDPKGVQTAITLAEESGERLKIVGNVEDPAFFDELIKPHLSDTIEFVGEVHSEQTLKRQEMVALFQGAKAFINPINWEEPFGLVMAEAAACGTPVIAYKRGSVAELVVDGKTGFIVDPGEGVAGLKKSLGRVGEITSQSCREHAIQRFSKARMADDYEKLYSRVVLSSSG